MLITFKHGFEHDGFLYGWYQKELYRLPICVGTRKYRLKKLNAIMVGNKVGYRIRRAKLTIEQLKDKTMLINTELVVPNENPDLP